MRTRFTASETQLCMDTPLAESIGTRMMRMKAWKEGETRGARDLNDGIQESLWSDLTHFCTNAGGA